MSLILQESAEKKNARKNTVLGLVNKLYVVSRTELSTKF